MPALVKDVIHFAVMIQCVPEDIEGMSELRLSCVFKELVFFLKIAVANPFG